MKFRLFLEKCGLDVAFKPEDLEGLYVIGNCSDCKLLQTGPQKILCPIYRTTVGSLERKDFGCLDFEGKIKGKTSLKKDIK